MNLEVKSQALRPQPMATELRKEGKKKRKGGERKLRNRKISSIRKLRL